MQEFCDESGEVFLHFSGHQVAGGIQVIEDGPVHGDDRQAQVDPGQELAHRCGCLFGGDGVLHAFVDEAVDRDLCIGGEPPVFPEEYIVDTGYIQGAGVRYPRQMDRADRNPDADPDGGVQGPVKDKDPGIGVPDMGHADAHENDRGEPGGFRDL